jgi:small conductance mechanosensitive channel
MGVEADRPDRSDDEAALHVAAQLIMSGLFTSPFDWRSALTAIGPTLVVAVLAALLVKRALERLLKAALNDHVAVSSPHVQGPLRLIAVATFVITVSLIVVPALELVGLKPRRGVTLQNLGTWALEHGVKVLVIALIGYAIVRTTSLLVRRFEHQVSRGTTLDALERAKRARTLGSLIERVCSITVTVVSLLMILDQVGVNIAPALTGAGIAGLAVGFGAQALVRDIISGFFLILEDQVRVGDVASINGTGGLVEQINLRTIVLRDEEGAVHVFPNGAITTLANRSKDFSYYVIALAVPYNEDPDRVVEILRRVGAELQQDHRFGPFVLEPIEIMGLDSFDDWAMRLKLRIKTVPVKQWEVGRELRRRIRRALDAAGVNVPFPAITAAGAEGGRDRSEGGQGHEVPKPAQ